MSTVTLIPRQPVPSLSVSLVTNGSFILGEKTGTAFDLVVFYRGLHCPICVKYLLELEQLVDEFEKRGVGVVAVSCDSRERAEIMAQKVQASKLRIGYGLSLESAHEWGLYISRSRGVTSAGMEEPALFSEPGLFMIRPDGTLYYGSTQSMPFARPSFHDLLGAIDFVTQQNYPARGEYFEP